MQFPSGFTAWRRRDADWLAPGGLAFILSGVADDQHGDIGLRSKGCGCGDILTIVMEQA